MDPHTECSILINAPITFVWHQIWENFQQENELTKHTNITKKKTNQILRTVTINEKSHKEELTKHQKERTIKNQIVDGDIFGEFTYELEQNPKGQVILKLNSNIIDENKKFYPSKAALEHELALHKERVEYKHKNPKKRGIFC